MWGSKRFTQIAKWKSQPVCEYHHMARIRWNVIFTFEGGEGVFRFYFFFLIFFCQKLVLAYQLWLNNFQISENFDYF